MSAPICELRGVGVTRGGRRILDGVDFSPRPGELTALVGANGAGKSTLLRLLVGVWTPSEGAALLDGAPLAERSRREIAQKVVFVPQSVRPTFDFSVEDYVAMGRYAHEPRLGRRPRASSEIVAQALRWTDVEALRERTVTHLSGGELQRVLLARCLATEAPCVILDEPTAQLDIAHALEVLGLCRRLAEEGRTVVTAIHDLNAALRYAHRAVVLHRGAIIADGAPAEVLSPETLGRAFGVEAWRVTGPENRTLIDFAPRSAKDAPNE